MGRTHTASSPQSDVLRLVRRDSQALAVGTWYRTDFPILMKGGVSPLNRRFAQVELETPVNASSPSVSTYSASADVCCCLFLIIARSIEIVRVGADTNGTTVTDGKR